MGDSKGRIKLDVLILGGGFAGVYCAKSLVRDLGRNRAARIGMVSDQNYMVFQPMLPEVAGAAISPRHVVNPLRLLCRGVEVFKGRVESVSLADRRVVVHAGAFVGSVEIEFEHLVMTLGAVVDLRRIPGMPEHAFLIQNVGDAMLLRTTIIGRIEEANLEPAPEVKKRLLTFVVVGGGYSGTETAGQILDLFRAIHSYYPKISKDDLQVVLVHSEDHLLPTMSRKLGEYSARKLEARGLRLILNERVRSVTANRVYLSNGNWIESNTVISTVGTAPHPLTADLCRDQDLECEKGRIITDDFCRIKGEERIWAAGDCAAVPYVRGGWCPGTAQFAMRQGKHLGKNLARVLQGKVPRPFRFPGYGELAAIGHRVAVGELFGFRFSGFLAWWMWRTVYLAKLPRMDRKVRVMLDWTLDLFFPRDINLLSPKYSELLKEVYLEEGDVLVRRDEPAFSFYIVKSGSLRLTDADGNHDLIGAGEYFGERALMGDGVWHEDVVAREPVRLVSVPARVFRQITRGSGSLAKFFMKSAGKHKSREMMESILKKLPARCAEATVGEIMSHDLELLHPKMPLHDALEIAKRRPHSSYPVVDDEGALAGVVHRDDLYDFIKSKETEPDTPIEKMEFGQLPLIREQDRVHEVVERLVRAGANKAIVVDEQQRVRGIVTLMDLMIMTEEKLCR